MQFDCDHAITFSRRHSLRIRFCDVNKDATNRLSERNGYQHTINFESKESLFPTPFFFHFPVVFLIDLKMVAPSS